MENSASATRSQALSLKLANKKKILKTLLDANGIPRFEIAEATGLDRSTVTKLTKELIQDGLVYESDPIPMAGSGRRAIGLEFNFNARCLIGVQIGDSKTVVLAVNLRGTVLDQIVFPNSNKDEHESLVERIRNAIRKLLVSCKCTKKVLGIGIGVAGIVNPRNTRFPFMPNVTDDIHDITEVLGKAFSVPVFIDNEVKTMALAALWFGEGRGYSSLLFMHIGRGIGSALVYDGKVYRGAQGIAGEVGHTIVDVDGPLCGCGNRGCLETLAGGQTLINAWKRTHEPGAAGGELHDFSQMRQQLNPDEPVIAETLASMQRYLAVGIVNAIHSFNPELFLIGGEFAEAFPEVILGAIEKARPLLLGESRSTSIQLTSLPQHHEALGATALVLENFFNSTD